MERQGEPPVAPNGGSGITGEAGQSYKDTTFVLSRTATIYQGATAH